MKTTLQAGRTDTTTIDDTVVPATFTRRGEENGGPHAALEAHVPPVSEGQIAKDRARGRGRWLASLLADKEEAGRG